MRILKELSFRKLLKPICTQLLCSKTNKKPQNEHSGKSIPHSATKEMSLRILKELSFRKLLKPICTQPRRQTNKEPPNEHSAKSIPHSATKEKSLRILKELSSESSLSHSLTSKKQEPEGPKKNENAYTIYSIGKPWKKKGKKGKREASTQGRK